MNLVGKIFTVLIFVAALVIMSFTVMVYAVQKNWRLVADNPGTSLEQPHGGLSQQLADERKTNQKLQDDNERVSRALAMEKTERAESLAKLEQKNDFLSTEYEKQKLSIDEKTKAADHAVAALEAAHVTLRNLRADAVTLGTEIKKAHEERDASFKQVVDLNDKLNSAVNERTQLNERNVQLAADFAKAQAALRWFLGPNFSYKSDYKAKQPPHPLDGVVLAVPEQNLVEISIGADDGLRKGHKLEVVRMDGGSTSYVGRIEVQQVTPDRAVCRVLPEMLRSPMQRGDRVFDRLD